MNEQIVGGKYRLGRKLGGGSFGEIFLGELRGVRLGRESQRADVLGAIAGTNLQTGEEVGVKLVR